MIRAVRARMAAFDRCRSIFCYALAHHAHKVLVLTNWHRLQLPYQSQMYLLFTRAWTAYVKTGFSVQPQTGLPPALIFSALEDIHQVFGLYTQARFPSGPFPFRANGARRVLFNPDSWYQVQPVVTNLILLLWHLVWNSSTLNPIHTLYSRCKYGTVYISILMDDDRLLENYINASFGFSVIVTRYPASFVITAPFIPRYITLFDRFYRCLHQNVISAIMTKC